MPDLDHPLEAYATRFKDLHDRNASEYFDRLVQASGVDEQQNRQLVAELADLQSGVDESMSLRNGWLLAGAVGLTFALASGVGAFSAQGWALLLLIPALVAVLLTFTKVREEVAAAQGQLRDLERGRDAKQAEAWAQMEPLNRLHTWDAAPTLFQMTLPAVRFDAHVSHSRLDDLVSTYGLSREGEWDRSALFSQSGSLHGNPFVFQRFLQHWMGSRNYSGSRTIRWTERVRNAQGNWVNTQRSQTLTASVVKPHPEFNEGTGLAYGHEAAPELSFSRKPSAFAGLGEGSLGGWLKDQKVKKIERQARRQITSGGGQLAVMSNKEFEALFAATDRDDEISFRLLFTPLAQQEMVKLLNSRDPGYGDDFTFTKRGPITLVEPRHLDSLRFDGNPEMFRSPDLSEARRTFTDFHRDYFRSLYFSLGPILTIPSFREQRSVPESSPVSTAAETSEWEHEAMANLFGEDEFRHPDSVTRNVLKTSATLVAPAVHRVNVTAYGYRGVARVDHVPVWGRDGRMHDVAVPWTEYIGVHAERTMLIGVVQADEDDIAGSTSALLRDWDSALHRHGADAGGQAVRGALAGCLLP